MAKDISAAAGRARRDIPVYRRMNDGVVDEGTRSWLRRYQRRAFSWKGT